MTASHSASSLVRSTLRRELTTSRFIELSLIVCNWIILLYQLYHCLLHLGVEHCLGGRNARLHTVEIRFLLAIYWGLEGDNYKDFPKELKEALLKPLLKLFIILNNCYFKILLLSIILFTLILRVLIHPNITKDRFNFLIINKFTLLIIWLLL